MCGSPITLRTTGGARQRFCTRPERKCRHEFRAALIAWADEQLTLGRVTTAELRAALARKTVHLNGTKENTHE